MFQRLVVKEDSATLGNTDTSTFLLPNSLAISELLLVIRSQNDSTHNAPDACAAQTVLEALEKIEVRTGDRVFKSYTADVAMALATYRYGREPKCDLTQVGGTTYPTGWQEVAIPIQFNRFGEDPMCGLPAPLYTGLELSLKYDFSTTDAGGKTAFEDGAAYHRYDLYAELMPHMHTSSLQKLKVLTNMKRQNYTTRANGTDLINLTTSPHKMLRNILVRAYKTGVDEGTLFEELDVLVDGQVVAEDTWRHWQNRNAEDCELDFMRKVNIKAQTEHDVYYSTIPDVQATFQAISTGAEDMYLATTGDQVAMASQTADDLGELFLRSDVIPATAIIDFDRNLSLRDLLNINVEKLHLRVLNAGAAGDAEIYESFVEPAVLPN